MLTHDPINLPIAKDTNTPPASLVKFQQQFGQYLRSNVTEDELNISLAKSNTSTSPMTDTSTKTSSTATQSNITPTSSNQTNPTLQSPRRARQLYQSLVFNNVCGFLDKCFPVCQTLLTKSEWRHLCQQFFSSYSCHSPYFTQINESFVDYLADSARLIQLGLPAYFGELAHYEWIELAVDTYEIEDANSMDNSDINVYQAHVANALSTNPTLQNLHYQWSVHTINANNLPKLPEDSFFLIHRDPISHRVKFMQTNALTHALINFIDHNPSRYDISEGMEQLILDFCDSIGYVDGATLVGFATPLIRQLISQSVLLYTSYNA